MAKRKDDSMQIFEYRLDVLERRLDTIERLLHSNKNENINTELLSMLLNVVKQNIPTQKTNDTEMQQPNHKAVSLSDESIPPTTCTESFLFNRRRTLI